MRRHARTSSVLLFFTYQTIVGGVPPEHEFAFSDHLVILSVVAFGPCNHDRRRGAGQGRDSWMT